MSDAPEKDQKTEAPTEKRRRDASEKGDVLQSKELGTALVIVAGAALLIARVAHAYVHVTSNRLQLRGPVFGLGLLVLFLMWLIFVVRILAGLP